MDRVPGTARTNGIGPRGDAGSREANKVRRHAVLVRMMSDTRTKICRLAPGRGESTKKIVRCLKRCISREIL